MAEGARRIRFPLGVSRTESVVEVIWTGGPVGGRALTVMVDRVIAAAQVDPPREVELAIEGRRLRVCFGYGGLEVTVDGRHVQGSAAHASQLVANARFAIAPFAPTLFVLAMASRGLAAWSLSFAALSWCIAGAFAVRREATTIAAAGVIAQLLACALAPQLGSLLALAVTVLLFFGWIAPLRRLREPSHEAAPARPAYR